MGRLPSRPFFYAPLYPGDNSGVGMTGSLYRWSGLLALLLGVSASAQVLVSGRVVDDTGAGVAGARVEIGPEAGPPAAVASSDPAGNFKLTLPAPGAYRIRAERPGFYLYQGGGHSFSQGANQLTITLNHLQEFSERIDVTASPPVIDPQQPAQHRELDNTEIQSVPYPAPQDYRNALPLMDGVVQDNAGRAHFNGGDTNQANYTLDGFNISNPVTGNLDARVNIDTIQSTDLESSRFSPYFSLKAFTKALLLSLSRLWKYFIAA